MEVKNKYAYVITQDICNKFIEVNFFVVKFIYSEKATKFCEISTNYLSYVLPVK